MFMLPNVVGDQVSFSLSVLTLISAWISNNINYKVWDGITYLLPNFNGATVDV